MPRDFITIPSQIDLAEALLFDLTGISFSLYEVVGFALAIVILNVALKSPLSDRSRPTAKA